MSFNKLSLAAIQTLLVSKILVSFTANLASSQIIVSICLGTEHGCATFDDNKLKCWGDKTYWGLTSAAGDRFGDDPSELGTNLPYVNIGGSVGAEEVSCGDRHVCVRLNTGGMKCLGHNTYGQIGLNLPATTSPIGAWNGYIGNNLPVVNLAAGNLVFGIALGKYHSCALLSGNKAKCFGENEFGQLGQGDTNDRGTGPSQMGHNLPFIDFGTGVEIASIHSKAAANHNCIILSAPATSAQRAKCWGSNASYQLGYGDTNNRGDEPGEMGDALPLLNLGTESRVSQIAIGESHTCALLINNVLKCWGAGNFGQLGSGSTAAISATGNALPAVQVMTGSTLRLISAGIGHTCILFNNQLTMKCMGANSFGQLGLGIVANRGNTPTTKIPNIPAIAFGTGSVKINSIHAGGNFNCVVLEDNQIKCFGANTVGQLLIGTATSMGDNANEMGANLPFAAL